MADDLSKQLFAKPPVPYYNDVTGEVIKDLPKRPDDDIIRAQAREAVTKEAASDIERKIRVGRGVGDPASVNKKAKGGMVRGVGKALRGYGKGKLT